MFTVRSVCVACGSLGTLSADMSVVFDSRVPLKAGHDSFVKAEARERKFIGNLHRPLEILLSNFLERGVVSGFVY